MKKYSVILGSNSPRRQELLAGLDIEFTVKAMPEIDESYPADLPKNEVARYIAKKKADTYTSLYIPDDELLITADTVVLLDDKVYGKPKDEAEAMQMLRELSGKTHQVVTGVAITSTEKQRVFDVTSEVRFAPLAEGEIQYYVNKFKPLDKAGAYGIQEWIGYIAVEHITGSYFNIVGLPVQRLYTELKDFFQG